MINDPNLSTLLRIASALERIADALSQKRPEKLRDKPKSAPVTLASATLEDRVLAALRRGPMSARDLQRNCWRHGRAKASELREALYAMERAGLIISEVHKPARGKDVALYSLPTRGKGSASLDRIAGAMGETAPQTTVAEAQEPVLAAGQNIEAAIMSLIRRSSKSMKDLRHHLPAFSKAEVEQAVYALVEQGKIRPQMQHFTRGPAKQVYAIVQAAILSLDHPSRGRHI